MSFDIRRVPTCWALLEDGKEVARYRMASGKRIEGTERYDLRITVSTGSIAKVRKFLQGHLPGMVIGRIRRGGL